MTLSPTFNIPLDLSSPVSFLLPLIASSSQMSPCSSELPQVGTRWIASTNSTQSRLLKGNEGEKMEIRRNRADLC